MSAAAAPWSVKGIDPKAKEIAKDLARRSGMTLGEWLNSMIMDEPEDDDQVATLPRRSPIPDPYDRRNRSRRLDDAYSGPSIDVIASRLEEVEQRSADAIRSIEMAVTDLVRRLDKQEDDRASLSRRLETVADELREGHQRLKRVEAQDGRDGEDRLTQVSQRLDEAQTQTRSALKALERSFASLDERLLSAEAGGEAEPRREASQFERLAETLARQVEGNRIEMMRRMDVVEIDNRAERLERALAQVTEHSREAEKRSAAALEAMGHEVMRIAQNLNVRMARVEDNDQIEALGQSLSQRLGDRLDRELDRHAQAVDLRLNRSDDQHARAIERLGDEITRISDRLSDRIASSERRSSEALDDIRRRLSEHSERLEHRQIANSDLAERMRQSEERTAQLLADAQENMVLRAERAATEPQAPFEAVDLVAPEPVSAPEPMTAAPVMAPLGEARPWTAQEAPQSDWRAAAFGNADDIWSDDDLDGLLDAAPFPSPPHEAQADGADDSPVETELGAWVEARTQEVAPSGPFGSRAEALNLGRLSTEPEPLVFNDETVAGLLSETALSSGPDFDVGQATDLAFDEDGAPRDESDILREAMAFVDLMEAPLEAPLHSEARPDTASLEPTSVEPEEEQVPFVDPEALKAAAEAGRASSTRDALNAARAAMVESEEPVRQGFGLKRRGGKSKLQERLDKQARGEGSIFRKTLGASALAALVVGGGYGFLELSDTAGLDLTGKDKVAPAKAGTATAQTGPIAAMALSLTPTDATPAPDIAKAEGASLFERAIELLDKGDDRGLEALNRAAELGHAGAQLRLAGLYQEGGAGLEVNEVEARNWARRAAEGGDARAMHYYAMQLYDGTGGTQNRAAALGWLKRAAEAGRVDSQYNVARLYEKGDVGVAANPFEAFKWYMIAARRGDQQALAAVQRLSPTTDAETRRKVREAADAFNVDPVA